MLALVIHFLESNSNISIYTHSAHFHLRNGAVIWRLNWMADCSVKGLSASCGLMVNYRYYLDTLAENSINYVENKQVTADKQVLELLKPYSLASKL